MFPLEGPTHHHRMGQQLGRATTTKHSEQQTKRGVRIYLEEV